MAKYERHFKGNFNAFLENLNSEILGGSMSASYEDGSDIICDDVRCAVRVYERYSYTGGNRVSASVTVLSCDDDIFVSAITSGGSQAMFFKINTIGEDSFLDAVEDAVERSITHSK